MLGLALIVLAVANVARVARPTDHERAPPTHAVNIGVAARVPTETASSTASVAPTGTPTASVAPTATPNDWSSLTAVALDIGLAGVDEHVAARVRRDYAAQQRRACRRRRRRARRVRRRLSLRRRRVRTRRALTAVALDSGSRADEGAAWTSSRHRHPLPHPPPHSHPRSISPPQMQ
jgi:hypothetical protein